MWNIGFGPYFQIFLRLVRRLLSDDLPSATETATESTALGGIAGTVITVRRDPGTDCPGRIAWDPPEVLEGSAQLVDSSSVGSTDPLDFPPVSGKPHLLMEVATSPFPLRLAAWVEPGVSKSLISQLTSESLGAGWRLPEGQAAPPTGQAATALELSPHTRLVFEWPHPDGAAVMILQVRIPVELLRSAP
jgi:hypothetical protein